MKPPSDHSDSTVDYYDSHAEEFCGRTASVDMTHLYEPFLVLLSVGGRILDAGCGSGRDSLAFLQRGYSVLSIDASAQMVKATIALTHQDALQMRFEDIQFADDFDGIWACASLLHVRRPKLSAVLAKLGTALRIGGVLYASFKYGDSERIENGRYFNDLEESNLNSVLAEVPGLELLRSWVTEDVRAERPQKWLNALAQRSAT